MIDFLPIYHLTNQITRRMEFPLLKQHLKAYLLEKNQYFVLFLKSSLHRIVLCTIQHLVPL
jgi:hypothetical protein